MSNPAVRWLEELEQTDTSSGASSVAHLATLASLGLPVLPGFIVTLPDAKEIENAYHELKTRLNQSDLTCSITVVCDEQTACTHKLSRHFAKDINELQHLITNLTNHSGHHSWLLVQPALTVETSGTIQVISQDTLAIEVIVGEVTPLLEGRLTGDHYRLDRETGTVLSRDINKQTWQLVRQATSLSHKNISPRHQSSAKASESTLATLADMSREAFSVCGDDVTLYWSTDIRGKIWLHYITPKEEQQTEEALESAAGKLQGIIATRGRATGPARIVTRRLTDHVDSGAILVTELADHAIIPLLTKIRGIITETGRIDSKLATAAREHGIPYLYGVRGATHKLRNGILVTVDGDHGVVSIGKATEHTPSFTVKPSLITGTKVYTSVHKSDTAHDLAAADSDGIGHLSLDSLLSHPMIGNDMAHGTFEVSALSMAIQQFAKIVDPKPVYLSLTDHIADEASASHRLLGYRGASRHLLEPERLQIELEAIRQAQEAGVTNIYLSLPFVRTIAEFHRLFSFLAQHDLAQSSDLSIGLLCQTPANVIMLEQFIHEGGIHYVTIDLDTLAELTLGADRNHELGQSYSAKDDAVLISLKHCLELCHHHGVATNVIGESIENDPEMVTQLVRMGATAVTVPSSDITSMRHLIASAEQRLLLDHALNELHETH